MNRFYLMMMSAAALLFASCGDGEKDRNVAPSKVKVEVQTVGDASASGMRYSGTVEEGSGAALSFPVSGTVNRILVSTGSHVKKGQLLATLDASSMRSLHVLRSNRPRMPAGVWRRCIREAVCPKCSGSR